MFSIYDPDREISLYQGLFWFEEKGGFRGRIYIANYSPSNAAFSTFELPDLLQKPHLQIRTEDGNFATICFPVYRKRQWKNFDSLKIEFTFRYLVDGVGIGNSENAVSSISLYCDTLASLISVRPVNYSFAQIGGKADGVNSFFYEHEPVKWTGKDYDLSIGFLRNISSAAGNLSVTLKASPCLELKFSSGATLEEALKYIRMLDDFIGVISGKYVQFSAIKIGVLIEEEEGEKVHEFALEGYGVGFEISDFVDFHDVLAVIPPERNWCEMLDTFRNIWEQNEIVFKWFRTSQLNVRYLEEKFGYIIRIVEKYFTVEFQDRVAVSKLSIILQRSDGDDELISFIRERVAPIFKNKTSLAATVRKIFENNQEFKAAREIEPRFISNLRGREMHGSSRNYGANDYGAMSLLHNTFLVIFRIDILIRLGFLRAGVIERLRQTSAVELF